MADVLIVGDGPAGMSAALFLAKKGMNVTVFGIDETPMHYAMLYNYLGIPEITGSDFQKVARAQVEKFGAILKDEKVAMLEKTADGFSVTTEAGVSYTGTYVVLGEGKAAKLAESLGLERSKHGMDADRDGRTAIEGLYVTGRSTKPRRSQAIISAGEGAAAALDILSVEAGKDVLDYDTVD